ncbi:FAD/FMN-dependent dehydrogenase [Desulfosporosinus orientis DSM 765]|uniref:FAD/FMN-dependent dehydrogenase n=1 Tax=Desulfosporosinus orientis (strain ATCC 19365 / DSM 765 / NCIMB 8382 / VKM B-1628 / Singapore I) TaxID=768706 RepID=G7W823_DESOD|nr:FAD-linked oxidase C-terminal domain-containing protein [Desulfosporosinus orientis]AET66449.1 FAD/FMN-dependent dehydrogenase [Desulfosporosinus orientis DSM 765]
MRAEIIQKLGDIVGEDNIYYSLEDLYCYTYDASFVKSDPKKDLAGVAVYPGSTEEVAEILKLANQEMIPVVPRGAGSNVSGGTISVGDSIILVLKRMNKIIEIDSKNLIAVVESGVITAQLQKEVERVGLFYPPDPASLAFSTMGGNVAECAGGPRGVKYGVTRDYVIGLEAVLPNGEIINTGGRTMKNVTGYDMTKLFTGSEGTLCVITKIIVKLIPLPEAKSTMMAVFSEIDQACETVSEIIAAGLIPCSLELLDNIYIKNIEEYAKVGLPIDAGAVLLIEVDGDSEILAKQIAKIEQICRQLGAVQIRVAKTKEEAEELWAARRAAFAAVSRLRPTIIGEDATVPRSKIPVAVRRIQEIAAKYDIIIAILGHAGDGNLHATILTDETDLEEAARVEKAVDEIFVATVKLGGSLSGEHGIGRAKSKFITLQTGEAGLKAQRQIKKALDPNNILNPGVMFGA